jgi:two-component system CheB/CheR fusion protein
MSAIPLCALSSRSPALDQNPWRPGLVDAAGANVCIIDASGIIIKVNKAWRRFAEANGCSAEALIGVGADYLDACAKGAASGEPSGAEALEGILSVMQGTVERFELHYPCHSPDVERWFLMLVSPVPGRGRFIIAHEQILIPSLN